MSPNNFKCRTTFIGSFSILIICLLVLTFSLRPNAGLQQLAADFRAANQATKIEPMLNLYHLEGSDESSITLLKAALQYEIGLPVQTIEFEPLSGASEETIQFVHNGAQYGPTLKPRYKMRVTYSGKERLTGLYTIGKTESGDWKFIMTKPIPQNVNLSPN